MIRRCECNCGCEEVAVVDGFCEGCDAQSAGWDRAERARSSEAVTPVASDECSCGTGCTEPGGADDAEFARHVEAVHERRDRMRMADAQLSEWAELGAANEAQAQGD